MQPPGGHALYLDARAFLPQVPISNSTLVSSNYTIRHAAAEVHHFPDPDPVATKPEPVVFAEEKKPTLLVLRDHSAYVAQSYWLDGDAIRCVTADGNSTLIPIANIDLASLFV